jgi:hypothetical protein
MLRRQSLGTSPYDLMSSSCCRTNVFFITGALNLAMVVIVPPISSVLIDRYGSLTTYNLSIPILAIPLFVLLFIPETTSPKETDVPADQAEPEANGTAPQSPWQKTKNILHGFKIHVQDDLFPVLESTKILRGLFGVVVVAFSEMLSNVLMQYAHVRFNWSYEKAIMTVHVLRVTLMSQRL